MIARCHKILTRTAKKRGRTIVKLARIWVILVVGDVMLADGLEKPALYDTNPAADGEVPALGGAKLALGGGKRALGSGRLAPGPGRLAADRWRAGQLAGWSSGGGAPVPGISSRDAGRWRAGGGRGVRLPAG